jgi:hypothetical protein
MTRSSVLGTGLLGLGGAVFATALCLFAVSQNWLPLLVSNPYLVWSLFAFLAIFSLAEIPLMIFGIKRMARSVDPRGIYVALATNVIYVLFGAVYALPFILLTGRLADGLALAALAIVRFISAMVYLPHEKQL